MSVATLAPVVPLPVAPSTKRLGDDELERKGVGETEAVRETLGLGPGHRWRRRVGWGIGLLLAAGLITFGVVRLTAPAAPLRWLTAPVTRADLTTTVTATGTLQPVRTVEVAAEISGRIVRVLVEANAVVARGQPLVEIDAQRLQSELAQAQAQAAVALAASKEATVTLAEAQDELGRTKGMVARGLDSVSALVTAKANFARAQARVAIGAAQELLAAAQVASVQTDLGKAIILAPIDGVVLTRTVEPGNAVAATFQAPVLMTLAQDLVAMQLTLDIDEADVGVVKAGQLATFTVDAFPDHPFPATVTLVALASKTVSNVVTYPATLSVDNHARLLRPGMTVTAIVTTGVDHAVLTLPNAALRFSPPATGGRTMFSGGSETLTPEALALENAPKVYILEGGQPVAVPVARGASDGQRTVVSGARLSEGTLVVVGQDLSSGAP